LYLRSFDPTIKTCIERFDRLDTVINNAGDGQYGIFETIPQENKQSNFDVNIFGVMNVIRAIVPVFRKRRMGSSLTSVPSAAWLVCPPFEAFLETRAVLES
jgi:NAD(P)-dependent dehydrogenase (short-subunit alcohol dehydrogenase family)